MALWNEDIEDVVICNEYELRNVIDELDKLSFDCNDDGNYVVSNIELMSSRLSEEDRQDLENEVNGLLAHIRDVDRRLREVVEIASDNE
ncbi:hypothetical protein KAT92_06195 [Candidatus Babeliales bacterium]|nr:hypothetical protein [Candidatus Babeliales bacterium]